ncbi:hypothetical protein BJ944DRAFT_270658 [Cunninghamella echinulata]|nr:hypothetical protein BJ944DRAFT_270658 [Cunninghamella echinulata]
MDDHWCTNCDKAISAFSNSLYCSEECLRADALNHHPLLGYDYAELKDFPRSSPTLTSTSFMYSSSSNSSCSSSIYSPSQSPIPTFTLPSPKQSPKSSTLWHHPNKLSPPVFELEPKLDTPPSSPPVMMMNRSTATTKRNNVFFI